MAMYDSSLYPNLYADGFRYNGGIIAKRSIELGEPLIFVSVNYRCVSRFLERMLEANLFEDCQVRFLCVAFLWILILLYISVGMDFRSRGARCRSWQSRASRP